MDTVVKVSAVALVGTVLILVLKKHAPEYAILVSLACGVVVLLTLTGIIAELGEIWERIAARMGNLDTVTSPLFKAVGIAVVTKIAAEFCRDSGEGALGEGVDFAGTCAMIVVMAPLAAAVLDLIDSMLSR